MNKEYSFKEYITYFFIAFGLYIFLAAIYGVSLTYLFPLADETQLLISGQAIGQVLLIVIFIAMLSNKFVKDTSNFKNNNALVIIILGIIGILVANFLVGFLLESLGYDGTSDNQSSIDEMLGAGGYVMIFTIIMILTAPIVEEVLFRDLLMNSVEKGIPNKFGVIVSIVASTLIFAALHSLDIYIIAYIPLSLVLVLSYHFSKNNIWVPIIIHFFNNALAIIGFFFLV